MRVSRLAIVAALASASAVACEAADRDGTSTDPSPATGSSGSDSAAATAVGDDANPTSGGSAGVTSEPPVPDFPCTEESECFLHGDCCSCVALHRDEPAPEDCPADCDRDKCDTWGLTKLLCSHECRIELVECDPAMVTCADAPPDCEDGELPSLQERCYSGHCVPQDLCRPF